MAAKMAAIFIENARTLKKAAKTCFLFVFWLPLLLIKENRYKYTHSCPFSVAGHQISMSLA